MWPGGRSGYGNPFARGFTSVRNPTRASGAVPLKRRRGRPDFLAYRIVLRRDNGIPP